MKKAIIYTCIIGILFFLNACSKKTHPGTTASGTTASSNSTTKPAAKKVKVPTPKVIVVNDSVASKTFDGRLYYDLNGHRYWRSNKDGKYYLYNKSMQGDPAFQKP